MDTAFIGFRVTPEMKTLVHVLAEREHVTESALIKQLLEVMLRTAALQDFPKLDELDRPNRDARLYVRLDPDDLVEFGRTALEKAERMGKAPDTFDFLGFTHIPGRSRRGAYRPGVRTMKKRLRRSLKQVGQWCKKNFHEPVGKQQETLNAKLRGHYQYYGRSSNFRGLWQFYKGVRMTWRQWLSRRTRGTPMSGDTYNQLLKRHPLLTPQITHTWANTWSPA